MRSRDVRLRIEGDAGRDAHGDERRRRRGRRICGSGMAKQGSDRLSTVFPSVQCSLPHWQHCTVALHGHGSANRRGECRGCVRGAAAAAVAAALRPDSTAGGDNERHAAMSVHQARQPTRTHTMRATTGRDKENDKKKKRKKKEMAVSGVSNGITNAGETRGRPLADGRAAVCAAIPRRSGARSPRPWACCCSAWLCSSGNSQSSE